MKFKCAVIQNFKLLRNVALKFSTEPNRPLTIIRAENGCGKTSTLAALQWGLFGDRGLDVSARSVRLSPSHWPDDKQCEIKVSIDFSHTEYTEAGGQFIQLSSDYRIVRSVEETPNGNNFKRLNDCVELYELADDGAHRVNGPEVKIAEMLPIEMEDVFFTDSDKAMTFISSASTKRSHQHQVKEAIRSLLGLGVLESAKKHINKASSEFNKQVAKSSGSDAAEIKINEFEEKKKEKDDLKDQLDKIDDEIKNLTRLYEKADKKLIEAVQEIGDPEKIASALNSKKSALKNALVNEDSLKKNHRDLLASESLSWGLLSPILKDGIDVLAKLADKGVIPATAIPVLQDRIDLKKCICGQDLSEGTEARKNVLSTMDTQRAIDDEKEALTALFHQAKMARQVHEGRKNKMELWQDQYRTMQKNRIANTKSIESFNREIKELENKISKIDEQGVQDLKSDRDGIGASNLEKQNERSQLQVQYNNCEDHVDSLKKEYEEVIKAVNKNKSLSNRMDVTNDIATVIENTLRRLQNEYLQKVSARMNELFLSMVKADPESAGGVFRGVEITENYDIRVNTADNRTLDPDHELNGASKRALTLSFIWALTDISGVIAPRVIDTPLGMMSGGVKRRVVEMISDPKQASTGFKDMSIPESSVSELQVVLFLTRQEILKIEDLLDSRAGKIQTYSNTDWYPNDLVNNPGVENPEILVCSCDHRQKCDVCGQKNDEEYSLVPR